MGAEAGSPFTILPGFKDAVESIQKPCDTLTPSQRFTQLTAEIALPSDANQVLDSDRETFFLAVYGHLLTNSMIRPDQSLIGPTELNDFLRNRLGEAELSLSPAFAAYFTDSTRAMLPGVQKELMFAANRAGFVTNNFLREYDLTDPFIEQALQVIQGAILPQDFDQELRPPRHSVDWAFHGHRVPSGFSPSLPSLN